MNFKLELTVGAFILMGFACVLVLAFASTNSAGRLGGDTYVLTARFSNTGELKPRAPVKISGVKIGEVAAITLDPQTFEALVSLRLSAMTDIPADTSAAIYTSGLLGERYIGLAPGGDPESLHDGDEIMLTQSAVVLEQLIGKFMFGGAEGKDGNSTPDEGHKAPDANDTDAADKSGDETIPQNNN